MFKNSISYSGALIQKSIPVEIRNANMIDAVETFNMDEISLVFIFVFTYLHRQISFDGIHRAQMYLHLHCYVPGVTRK